MLKLRKEPYKLYETPEFIEWFNEQTLKEQLQIDERLFKIILNGYFGTINGVGDSIWELKWTNGRRVYYAYITELDILILLGGNKNGQSKDIAKAKNVFKKHTKDRTKIRHWGKTL